MKGDTTTMLYAEFATTLDRDTAVALIKRRAHRDHVSLRAPAVLNLHFAAAPVDGLTDDNEGPDIEAQSARTGLGVGVSGCPGARTPGCWGVRVPGCPGAAWVSGRPGVRVPGCPGARVPGCPGAWVSGRPGVRASGRPRVRASGCPGVR
ncbi:unnamed protein product, partial [Prorocentrum cordatum]